jgi:S-adenosylmethionine synthetase
MRAEAAERGARVKNSRKSLMTAIVRLRKSPTPSEQPLEVVERKGLGHPDTICDAVAEQVSRRLCQYYLEHFGRILHHNVDKILLCGGSSRATFGGGEVNEPIELYLAGRATAAVRGQRVPVAELAVEACRDWLRANLPELDLERHVKIIPRLRPGSRDLTELFLRGGETPLANDTSLGVGFAPLTELEQTVLTVERVLSNTATRTRFPAIGSDIKVMGVRTHDHVELTIGCAFVGRHVAGLAAYVRAKETVRTLALEAASSSTRMAVNAVVNAADNLSQGEVFLTVTGTSAEAGDDGEVGRGNRANGLITPYRPMTLEAAAGKNPVNHVGKLYNLVARQIAENLIARLPGVSDATCVLVSRIGQSVQEPRAVDLQLGYPQSRSSADVRLLLEPATAVVRTTFANLEDTRRGLLAGGVEVY